MTDDIVKRLRKGVMCGDDPIVDEAADRIEELEKNFELQLEWYLSNKRLLDDRIKELEAALFSIYVAPNDIPFIKSQIESVLDVNECRQKWGKNKNEQTP